MELKLLGEDGKISSVMPVSDIVFGRDYNEALIHQVLVAFQANVRIGSRAQKNRASVKHSTRKPWRQKGTGKARAGMTSSPLWRGGGRAFPSTPNENFSHKVNKKMYRAAMCCIFSQLLREDRLKITETITVDQPKTKVLLSKLNSFDLNPLLIITDLLDENLYLASRNIPRLAIIEPDCIDPISLIHYKNILFTKSSVAIIEEMFA